MSNFKVGDQVIVINPPVKHDGVYIIGTINKLEKNSSYPIIAYITFPSHPELKQYTKYVTNIAPYIEPDLFDGELEFEI